jgi:signal transduction histidine kinase/CheY-like chemotaxis protein
MNLKQKVVLFVAVNAAGLLLVYLFFSNYYLREQEKQLFDGRLATVTAISQEFAEFFERGNERLNIIAELPGLVYGLQSLEDTREGKQIPVWGTLHYLFFESDVFTSGVYLVNDEGNVLWSEPPDVDLIEKAYQPYTQVNQSFRPDDPFASSYTLWESGQGLDILIAKPIADGDGNRVAVLIGAIPAEHPVIQAILRRSPEGQGTAQLVDGAGRVISSIDSTRQLQTVPYWQPVSQPQALVTGGDLVATAAIDPSGWAVAIDQPAPVALSQIHRLKLALTIFGIVFTAVIIGSLLFILRSFTRPVEALTRAARRIAEGDLTGRFTLNRSDEIGILAKTLDDMKAKLKSSYELLLQSEKMSLMGQIVAGIAHELNNPLTIVIGNVQLMQMHEKNEKNMQSLARVQEGAERASKIVKNLLAFARQEKPERKATGVNSVIMKTLDLRLYELRVNNIEVSTDLDPNLPETMADPHQLQQVFLNLVINAEQAMIEAHGKGLLRIKSRQEGPNVQILFSDDGPGISNENVRRIFEPFFTTKPVGTGTGLGLSICQGIIAEHGGRIDVESTIGRGTTFIVEIPIQRWQKQEAPVAIAERKYKHGRKKILVVEDEPQIRQLFVDVLKSEGYDVETAANGKIALELIDEHAYDLIISDVKMAELSGADLYTLIKRKGSALEHRFVFVTGDLLNPDTLQFIESTGRAWLRKPFDVSSITKTVAESLQ